jgi:gluconate 2-dehydrogenase gamma chain
MNRRELIKKTALFMGASVSAPAIMGILNGCTAEPSLYWTPKYVTKEQAVELEAIAETIIPATGTPGAKDAGVPAFIEKMVHEVYKPADVKKFMDGLAAFSKKVEDKEGDPFSQLDAAKQLEVIKAENSAALSGAGGGERPWFLSMKELTLLGFFTSEIGATQVLRYEAIPGRYEGCIPFSEVGKTWAT